MLFTKFWKIFTGTFYHLSWVVCQNCFKLFPESYKVFSAKMDQRCSIGFKFGYWGGLSKSVNRFLAKYVLITWQDCFDHYPAGKRSSSKTFFLLMAGDFAVKYWYKFIKTLYNQSLQSIFTIFPTSLKVKHLRPSVTHLRVL